MGLLKSLFDGIAEAALRLFVVRLRFFGGEFRSKQLRKTFRRRFSLNVGMYSYGCFRSGFNFRMPAEIGRYCSVAEGVQCIPGNHPLTDVSTHPFFHRNEYGYVRRTEKAQEEIPLKIGHDVWIGRNAMILPGCKCIGNGAVIGAGAVVTHDVGPYSVVAGNPAREIRKRFGQTEIQMLEASEWFLKSPEELGDCFRYADNVKVFIEHLGSGISGEKA